MNGGEAISSGGYGCIFRPSLKCKSNVKNKTENSNNYISKLLFNKNAYEEISEIDKVKPILLKIQNNDNFFLIQESNYCKPDTLSNNDLLNLNKCNDFFEKNNFNIKNINNELDQFTIINNLYGGIDLEKYLYSNKFSLKNFKTINSILINILNDAIIPMNKLNLIHMDLKDQNMLYSKNKIKIIDWGLCFIKTSSNFKFNYENFNNNLYRRPLQFNLPFSNLLLNNDFWKEFLNYYNYFHLIEKKPINNLFFRDITKKILYNFFDDNKYGHNLFLMENFIPLLYDEDDLNNKYKRFNKFLEIFTNIYSSIFIKYFDNSIKKFNINYYIENIYLYNCDIFGLVSVYYSIYDKFKKENNKNIDLTKLKLFIRKYMLDIRFYLEPYNIEELNEDIKDLNNYLQIKKSNKTKKKFKQNLNNSRKPIKN